MSYLFADRQTRKNVQVVKKRNTSTWQVSYRYTWQFLEGSRITYTPLSTSSTVIYEFYFAFSWDSAINNSDYKLQGGTTLGNMTDYDTGTANQPYHYSHGCHGNPNDSKINDLVILRYALDSWSGSKILQVSFKNRDDRNNFCRVHFTRHDGAPAYDSYYNAFVMCYEI